MKRILFLIAAIILTPVFLHAQDRIGRKPVKHETALKKELFRLEEDSYNHCFKITLPGDNFLLIDFKKMSYWPVKDALAEIFTIAQRAAGAAADSFKSPQSSKIINVHAPVKNHPLSVQVKEHNNDGDLLMLNYGQASALRLGMDTIRILKTHNVIEHKHYDDEKVELQYTFVLKELGEINKLADNTQLVNDIANTLDSVVTAKREKWNRQDTWYHQVGLSYTPLATSPGKLIVKNEGGFLKGLEAGYYMGATVFRNTVAPYLEVGGSYRWPDKEGTYNFFRLSFSAAPLFERQSESVYNFYSLGFVSFEIGELINATNTWVPIYGTSFGAGYMITDHPSFASDHAFKMFWNYSLSPAVRITPEVYVQLVKNGDNRVWTGLTIGLRVL